MGRKEVIEEIVMEYANDLGMGGDFCTVYEEPRVGVSTIYIKFKDHKLNKVLLKDGVKIFGNYGIIENLKEEVRKYFDGITLYLFASKHGELGILREVIDSGDHVYIMFNGNGYSISKDTHIGRLLEKTGSTCNYGIWKVKKKALMTYFMFYDGNNSI